MVKNPKNNKNINFKLQKIINFFFLNSFLHIFLKLVVSNKGDVSNNDNSMPCGIKKTTSEMGIKVLGL